MLMILSAPRSTRTYPPFPYTTLFRSFAADRIAPKAADIDEQNKFDRSLWPEMGALGLHGITVEEEYGGLGLGYLDHVVAMEEVSRASASIGLSYGAPSNQIGRAHV